jgi:hypothetical protein
MENEMKQILAQSNTYDFEKFLRKVCNEEYLGTITEEEGNYLVEQFKKQKYN